jgi:hypothetical protein
MAARDSRHGIRRQADDQEPRLQIAEWRDGASVVVGMRRTASAR